MSRMLTIRTNKGKRRTNKRRGVSSYALGAPRGRAPARRKRGATRSLAAPVMRRRKRGATRVGSLDMTGQLLFTALGGTAGVAANVGLDKVSFLSEKITDPTMYSLAKASIIALGAFFAANYAAKNGSAKNKRKIETAAAGAMGLAIGQAALTVYQRKLNPPKVNVVDTKYKLDDNGDLILDADGKPQLKGFLPRAGQVAPVANLNAYARRGVRGAAHRGVGYISPSTPTGTRADLQPASLANYDNAFNNSLS